ncbi:hypothetical protein BT63DRAFT_463022 [Microthyrium microscopicum]|uniref:Uncharacterized protein n=1 Tax=Microthyrium microscopicum TaxID=703497 RepID=A0A6A6U3Q5_9PEZI|nr:hypothetical protein BT63DRAFT_463022 [Microthyrium microscopicum]
MAWGRDVTNKLTTISKDVQELKSQQAEILEANKLTAILKELQDLNQQQAEIHKEIKLIHETVDLPRKDALCRLQGTQEFYRPFNKEKGIERKQEIKRERQKAEAGQQSNNSENSISSLLRSIGRRFRTREEKP